MSGGGKATIGAEKMPNRDVAEISRNKSLDLEPHDSMEFESKEDAFEFYKEYATSLGFSAIIKASRRSRISGKFIDAKFVCTRYGNKRSTSLSENSEHTDVTESTPVKKKRGRTNKSWSKTDCKACMHVKTRQDGRWTISSYIQEHNHDLVPDEPGLRNVDHSQHNVYTMNAMRNKNMPLSRQSGQMKITEHHESTSSSSNRMHLGFREGDAQVMVEYFSGKQDENPYFFYAMDLYPEQHLRNVFWVDAKGRIDYMHFGDVVLFDTTYKKNEFKLPFVPFIGMNNHFQFLSLGCALVADESKSTYVWLMRAWLRSMHGQAPKVILTDQDHALKEAIAEVLPESHHCFSLWHILSKVQEKLGYVIRLHGNFMHKFNKCILKSRTEAQFEKRWWKLVDRFDLRKDKWVESLYDDRLRWVPTFMKDIVLAGLSSAQRLESVSSGLDKCLLRKTSLKEFLHQYDIMLQEKYEDEAKADFETWHKLPVLKSPSPYGKQMVTVYTHVVFRKFQVEVLGVVACHPKVESEDGGTTTFKVQDFEENQVHKVTWNEKSSDTYCSCRLFEYNGFLCRHVMIVLQISGVNNIPVKYILKRWTKDAKNRETMKQVNPIESKNQRYSELCQLACQISDEGSLCQETYITAFTALQKALRKCENVNNYVRNTFGQSSPTNNGFHEIEEVTRGTFTSKTDKRGISSGKEKVHQEHEATTIGVHCWDQMGYLNFRAAAVECSYGSQESTHMMDHVTTIAPSHDDCYNNQPQMGQLNSTASLGDAHRLSLERLHQMGQLHFGPQNVPNSLLIQPNLQNQRFQITEKK